MIDGSSLLYRSYYGLRPLHTATGTPTQATYGFCRSIKKLIDDFDPKYLLITWDSKGKTFRSDIFEEYKATRQEAPSDLFVQKEDICEFAELAGIPQISKPGYEADDIIYSMVHDHKDKNIVIVGPDKDLHQLVSPNVVILDPMKKEVIDETVFFNKMGFEPKKLSFYHALLGDSSDNIPGVRGIGKKGATELVQQFESLDDLYANLEQVKKERTKKALEANKENAYLSLKLFSLKHIKLPITLKDIVFDKNNWKNANPLFKRLEFKRLIIEGGETTTSEEQTTFLQQGITSHERKKTSSTESGLNPPVDGGSKKVLWKCTIIRDEKGLESLVKKIQEKKLFALDTETTGLRPLQDELVGISIACDTKRAYYIPFSHENNAQLNRETVLEKLKLVFSSSSIKKTLHHTKFDQLALFQYGIEVKNIVFDTLLAANLLRKEWSKIGLKKLSISYLNEKMESFADVLGKKYKTFDQVPIPEAATYAAHDALQTLKLTKILKKELSSQKKLKKIFETIELPLSQVLFEMEKTGIKVDPKILQNLETAIKRKLSTIENKIRGALQHKKIEKPEEINLNSPKQIERLLFDDLKLPVSKKSQKGQRSTDQEVLSRLSEQHPVPGLILKYRELFKLKSTYIEALPKVINPKTKRIHTSFGQTIVATGRLSSSDPNLQNIPASGEFGLKIREAFVAPHGSQFLSSDYSQIELRVLAHLTGDKNLIESFLADEDIHTRTAAEIFEIDRKKVSHEQRQIGKRINFGIVYGQTPFGLSKELGIKLGEAKEYINKYFERYPAVASWMEDVVAEAMKNGFVETLMGRKRYVGGLKERNQTLFQAARRVAINTPVQGTSAEIMKLAMINIARKLEKKKLESKLILQIHDELLLECPSQELDIVGKLVKTEMESVVKWKVPLIAKIRTGKNWAKITK